MKAYSEIIQASSRSRAVETVKAGKTGRKARWSQVWRSLVAALAGNSDPHIQKISDTNWRVFDPASRQVLHFSSEQEIRVWLDQRYNF